MTATASTAGQIVRCASCGQANRLPAVGARQRAVCGKCRTPLDPGGAPAELTDTNFRSTISTGSWVVDFWAAWCGPCRMIAPIIDELARDRRDVRFGKLNVDQNPRTASAFGVQGIPLIVLFRDGVERGRVSGAVPRTQLEQAIARYLG